MSTGTLTVVHHLEEAPPGKPIIYFAGPTYFPDLLHHWHDIWVAYLQSRDYTGAVCLPTPRDNVWRHEDEAAQIDWQMNYLEKADVIVFYLPRLGPVTMFEFGDYHRSGKIILCIPSATRSQSGFVINRAKAYGTPVRATFKATLRLALKRLDSD